MDDNGDPRLQGDSIDQGDSSDHLPEVIMALDMKMNSMMGCAIFTTADGTLSLSDDIAMASTAVAEQFIAQAKPSTLLVSGRAPESLLSFLEKLATSGYGSSNFVLRPLSSSDFSHASALDRLSSLILQISGPLHAVFSNGSGHPSPNEPSAPSENPVGKESQNIQHMRCGTFFNLHGSMAVNCAGAVLADLHRRQATDILPEGCKESDRLRVASIKQFCLSEYMFIDLETFLSLQIVQHELHPNSQAWGLGSSGDCAKENLSVYGLFQFLASTPQGRIQLRQLFLRPTLNIATITARQNAISMLLRPENADKVKQATSILRKIRDVRRPITQLRQGIQCPSSGRSFDSGVWATLRRFSVETLRLKQLLGTLCGIDGAEMVCKVIAGVHSPSLVAAGEMISKTVDFDQSRSRHRCSVQSGVDPQLDELKRRYDGMGDFLTEVVNHVSQSLPEWACQYIRSCIFVPQLGFLVVVEPGSDGGSGKYEGDEVGGDRWEKMFTADGAVCYKSHYMKELDHNYGDMYCEIGDREVEIMQSLATAILKHEESLASASDLCGEFDALLALAKGAEKYDWVAPRMTTENIIQIDNGRHPLQELAVPSFVPNGCDVAGAVLSSNATSRVQPRALLLTGPNHSGKSIYLKQVAIIVYLAHIGSFVPAQRATVGITDKILTRIATTECVSRAESAFAIDLRQITQAMRCLTPRSLVLVDEFGKGTNVDDGAGLLAAVLNHFLTLGSLTPRLLMATHFHELLECGYLDKYSGLRFGHMDVKTDWEASRVDDQVTYLFSLRPGISTSSLGGTCAAMNGVPRTIVDRAETIALLLSHNEDLRYSCAKVSEQEERRLEEAETVARQFLTSGFDREGLGNPTRVYEGRIVKARLQDVLSFSM